MLSEGERAVVAAMWAFRARSENEAAARFVRIAERLERTGAHASLIALAHRAVADERRHRERCRALAERFGHPPQRLHEQTPPEVAPARLPERRRLTWELLAFCCLTESINAALLTHGYHAASEPESKQAMREILADEVQHARLGWAYLATCDDRAWLAEHLPTMLDATVPAELLDPRIQPEVGEALRAHGVFSQAELLGLLRETIEGVLVPGLTSFAIDCTPMRAWLERSLEERE